MSDVDLLSPLIFDWKAYALKYDKQLSGPVSESAAKTDWLAKLESLSYPNCRQGKKHDHPPGGFSLKLYFDANQESLNLGATPKCSAIAKQFLSEGLFEGRALAPLKPKVYDGQYPENDGSDGEVPASSWLMCKWRKGVGRIVELNLLDSFLTGTSTVQEAYSRAIRPYDMVLSNYDKAMYGFKPTASYTVTFWYRPVKRVVGEIFNFGESQDLLDTQHRGVYFSPSARQARIVDPTGVELDFTVSTTGNRKNLCKGNPATDGPDGTGAATLTVPHVLPFNKWTFVAISVGAKGATTETKIFYDNQASTVEKVASGNQEASTATLGLIRTCIAADETFVPRESDHGYAVSSFLPDPESSNMDAFGDLAGLTYYSKAFEQLDVEKLYAYEEAGVHQWSPIDAKDRNNGVC
jgi:hypothetical protein